MLRGGEKGIELSVIRGCASCKGLIAEDIDSEMTDRLAELRPSGASRLSEDTVGDVETGLDAEENRELEKFRRECEAINKAIKWCEKKVQGVEASQVRGGSVVEEDGAVEEVESKINAVRKRLKRIAEENKEFKSENAGRVGMVRVRVVQHTRLAKAFMEVVGELERVKEVRRGGLKRGLVGRVRGVVGEGAVGEAEVERAIDEGRVEMLVEERGGVEARYQLEDVRSRNREIKKVGKKMEELHQMFVDMSIIVDGQQDLLNQIEYNVQEAAPAVKNAAGQLEIAREHQKKKRKKIICLIITLIVLILVIVGIVLIVFRNQIFNKGNNNNSGGNQPNATRTARDARRFPEFLIPTFDFYDD